MVRVKRTPESRFWREVVQFDECWDWTGTKSRSGYGAFYDGTRTVTAHRWAYEYMVAPIPEGLHIDHLCRNRACVNPYHLDPVPPVVNTRRADGGAFQRSKTHCPKGHPYSDENTYRYKGHRHCRKCSVERNKAYKEKKQANMSCHG